MALGFTQPLTETSTRNISWVGGGAGAQCVGLTTLPPSCAVLKSWSPNLLETSGPLQACNGIALPLPFTDKNCKVSSAKKWAELCPTN